MSKGRTVPVCSVQTEVTSVYTEQTTSTVCPSHIMVSKILGDIAMKVYNLEEEEWRVCAGLDPTLIFMLTGNHDKKVQYDEDSQVFPADQPCCIWGFILFDKEFIRSQLNAESRAPYCGSRASRLQCGQYQCYFFTIPGFPTGTCLRRLTRSSVGSIEHHRSWCFVICTTG